ncbi:outer membrane beta-barrel family protein [Flavihumibacter petaseus]|uniref:Outer membrane protein beta-barrel domain-containing protein n=1 Tax=Flavihumibacter petaseus NBRC 106054 TaxID=1220578 RepID=A0A0E9N694_9BACT|nr:outer membrane beta-barrel family protein [Flavihumibacter petaseus]GAO45349.1 hypothetical protein FPE01S_05_00460 [Flavihumibacter petaseus NBRC 106054]
MRKFTNLICFLLIACAGYAQGVNIKGTVSDTAEKKPLANAAVVLLSKDSTLLKHVRTDAAGKFDISLNYQQPVILVIMYPKFADYLDEVKPGTEKSDLGSIPMIRKATLMEEVIVSQKIGAIRVKGDTLEYKADSFAVRQGANVEEMLKKLPGIQVNKKGEITAQGEKVQKVLVDGEEFFSDDPAVVTQNLRADAIDKVQVYDKKSDQAAFTGIDDGEKQKTINLQMKEDKKKGYFGKAKLGGGLPNYFENDAMINVFKGKRKVSAYGTMSNTGKAGLDWRDNDKFGGGDNFEYNEEEGYFFSYGESDEFNLWGGRYNGAGLPKAWTAGAHFSNKWDADKKHINGNYQFNKLDVETQTTNTGQYILPDTLYYNNERTASNTQNLRHKLSGYYDLKFDSLSSMKVNVSGSSGTARSSNVGEMESLTEEQKMVNHQLTRSFANGDKQDFKMNAIWRKKYKKKGRSLSVTGEVQYNANNSDNQLLTRTDIFDAFGSIYRTDTVDQHKNNYSQSNIYSVRIAYTEPLSKKWFLQLNYGYRINASKADRRSFNKDVEGKYEALDSLYSSNYSFDFNTNSGGLAFRYNGSKITGNIGGNISYADFKQTDLFRDSIYRYDYLNFFPKANIRFKLGTQTNLNFGYNGSTRQPTIDQIQPIVDNSNNLVIKVGNPDLKQEFRHSFNYFFNDYKVMTSRNIYINGNISFVNQAISGFDSVDYNTGRRFYKFVNVNGNIDYGMWAGYWKQIKKLKLNVNGNVFVNGGKTNNYINNDANTNKYFTVGANTGISRDVENKYNMELVVSPSYTKSRSTIRPDVVTKYWTVVNEFTVTVQLPWKMEINSNVNYSWRQKTDVFGADRNVWLWNGYLSKKFWKNKNGELRFSVNDILNQNIGFNRNVSSNFISESTYNTLRRYWLVSFIWNFSKTPGSK